MCIYTCILLVFIVVTVLIALWFLLMPGFVSVFVVCPTDRTSVGQGNVLGRSKRRAIAQTSLASTKMPRAPSAFP